MWWNKPVYVYTNRYNIIQITHGLIFNVHIFIRDEYFIKLIVYTNAYQRRARFFNLLNIYLSKKSSVNSNNLQRIIINSSSLKYKWTKY